MITKKFFLFLTAVSLSAIAQAQFPGEPRSRIITDSIYSETLGVWRQYNIYLPKSFDASPDQTYPILYLLHGMTETHTNWAERGHLQDVADLLVASGEACEMLIVMPNAGGDIFSGVWNGYFNMDGWAYEDFFYQEFMPYIEKTYRAIGDKSHRAIAGLSMGGGGATSYGQRHADLYCAVYAMSALMNIPEMGISAGERDDKMGILTRSVIEHSCVAYVQNADEATREALRSLSWFVDCGDDDFLLDRNIEFVQAMREARIPYEFRVRDGAHTWEYWHSALYNCLPYVTRCFGR